MPVTPETILDRQMIDRSIRPWSGRITGWRVDFQKWTAQLKAPERKKAEYILADRRSRRTFLVSLAGLGLAVATWRVYLAARKAGLISSRQASREYWTEMVKDVTEKKGGPADREEIYKLYLLKDKEGVKTLYQDIAIHSQGFNKDNFASVVFEDFSTWGRSNLFEYVKYYARLMKHLRTEEGRDQIRDGIEEHGGNYQEYYEANLKRLEDWIEKENLKGDLETGDLKRFFTKELGYPEEAWQIMEDLEKAWHKQDFSGDLRERINEFNRKNKVEHLIPGKESQVIESPEMAEVVRNARKAALVFHESGLHKAVDDETTLAVAQSIPAHYGVEELRTATKEVLLPAYVEKIPQGEIDLGLAFTTTVCLLAGHGSPKLKKWAEGQFKKLKSKFTYF